MKENIKTLLLGAGAGAAVGVGVWLFAQWQLNRSFERGKADIRSALAREVEAQVAPAVRNEIERTLARYNITPETGRRIDRILSVIA